MASGIRSCDHPISLDHSILDGGWSGLPVDDVFGNAAAVWRWHHVAQV